MLAGIFGSASVVAANAWMNSPSGFTLNKAGEIVEVDPLGVIFSDSMPLQAAHMILAAYVVGGFLVASVYAVGMLGAAVTATTVSGSSSRSPSRRSPCRSRLAWATRSPAVVQQPADEVRGDRVGPEDRDDVPETLLGRLNDNGTTKDPDPRLASWLSDPSTGTATVIKGLDSFPAGERPTAATGQRGPSRLGRHGRPRDAPAVAVRLVRRLVAVPARHAPGKALPLIAAASGVLAVLTMEAGWVVTEVGRQPWIVYEYMKVENAATGNTGVWIAFLVVAALYLGVGTTTILVLRGMSRRFRAGRADEDVPYGPRDPVGSGTGTTMSTAAAIVLFVGIVAYALFGGADFGAGFWDLVAGGTRKGERPRALIDHAMRPCGEPTTCG